MDALKTMGAYLRTLKVFQVEAATLDEDVLDSGLKIQYEGTTNLLAQAPAHLRVQVVNERHERRYFFDGKNFTLYAPRLKAYVTVPAPATIKELNEKLEDEHGITLPLVDLFRWGTPEDGTDAITTALDVGRSAVEGTTCEHYAFRQANADWQIWIQMGDYPLPRKLVITTLTDEARPQHSVTYTWNLAPSFNDAAFTFVPPKDARRVMLIQAPAARDSQ